MSANLIVTIPTVPSRAEMLAATVAQWRAIGCEPLVEMTPESWTPSPRTHALMLRQCLLAARTRDPGATVIFCEDDVLLSSRLADALPLLRNLYSATTLYLPGRRFYPARLEVPCSGWAWKPIINQQDWFGSQCLVLPPVVVAEVLGMTWWWGDENNYAGDMILRATLARYGRRLMTTVPNLVDHRAPPSVISRRYKAHRSWCYAP